MGSWDYFNYTPTKPRPVKGGIKAGGREAGGKNWWAKQWIKVLEGFNLGARLTRGRTYARKGQVISLDITKGLVTAAVQGSRSKPYKVKLKIKTLSPGQWQKVIELLNQQVIYSAKLLAGEMPADIETVFAGAGVSLFPERGNDLETHCSCPDWSNPCKHIAAVYYILGNEFDRDPFLIFKLRGLEREELLGKLSQLDTSESISSASKAASANVEAGEKSRLLKPEPLPTDLVAFWQGGTVPQDFLADITLPPSKASVLQQLGDFPFWRGNEKPEKSLQPVYSKAYEVGLKFTVGDD